MPTRDPEKRREQTRRAVAKHRGKACKPRGVSPTHVSPGVTAPRADWKGLGYCRDCNTKVPAKDNCCRTCFFEPETAVIPPLGEVKPERFPVYTTVPAWAKRPDKRALPDLAAISKSLAEAKLGEHVRFGVEGPTFAEIAKVLA